MDKINSGNDIRQFLNESSKQKIMLLIDRVKENPVLVEDIYSLAIQNEQPYSWRASWALLHLCKIYPDMLLPFADKIVDDTPKLETGRQIVSFLQILTIIDFPEQDAGHLFDLSISMLHDAKRKMSFKLYALLFLKKFIKKVPELVPELLLSIEDEDLISDNKYIRKQIKKLKDDLSNPIK